MRTRRRRSRSSKIRRSLGYNPTDRVRISASEAKGMLGKGASATRFRRFLKNGGALDVGAITIGGKTHKKCELKYDSNGYYFQYQR